MVTPAIVTAAGVVAVGALCAYFLCPAAALPAVAMMKAPGSGGALISRAAFEANPKLYFHGSTCSGTPGSRRRSPPSVHDDCTGCVATGPLAM